MQTFSTEAGAPSKILYQLVAPLSATVGPEEPARRQAFLEGYAAHGVAVTVRSAERARPSIDGDWDAVMASPAIVDGLVAAEAEGFAAGIVGCFSDPALGAAREAVAMPVVGPGQSAVLLALQVGDRISVLTPGAGGSGRTRAFMRALGLENRFASARGVGLSVVEMAEAAQAGTIEAAIDQVVRAAEACLAEDEADVLILGCMSMAFLDPTEAIAARVGVPVINPVIAALKAAETHVAMGLSHSRRRWPAAAHRPVISLASPNTKTLEEVR